MDAAKASLRAAFQKLTPFAELTSDRQRRERIGALRDLADILAVGCGKDLLRDACGADNVTAQKLAAHLGIVWQPNGNGKSVSRYCREYVINALAFLPQDVALKWVRDAGCNVGKGPLREAKKFMDSGALIFQTPQSEKKGRPNMYSKEKIVQAWKKETRHTGRVKSDGAPVLTFIGGSKRATASVIKNAACSKWAAVKHKPESIIETKKKTDLCPMCEGLRFVRRQLVTRACQEGARITCPSNEAGHRDFAGPGDEAAEYLANKPNQPKEIKLSLARLPTLKWHEEEAERSQLEYRNARMSGVTLTVDFASRIELRSERGDSREWRMPHAVGHFGMSLTRPNESNFDTHFFDVFYFGLSSSANVAAVCLEEGVRHARAKGHLLSTDKEVTLFSDRGKHFCSEEFAHAALLQSLSARTVVSLVYFTSYHGKSPLDTHFGQIKRKVGGIFKEKWSPDKEAIREQVVKAAESIKCTNASFLRGEKHTYRERACLKVRAISSVRVIQIVETPDNCSLLLIDGKECKLVVKELNTEIGTAVEDAQSDTERGCVVDIGALCGQLRRHQKRLGVERKMSD